MRRELVSLFRSFCTYLTRRWYFSVPALVFLIIILQAAAGFSDFTIPCLWQTLFGIRCPGCGTTRALIAAFHLDFKLAWQMNPLAFLVIPTITGYVIYDFFREYRKKENSKDASDS